MFHLSSSLAAVLFEIKMLVSLELSVSPGLLQAGGAFPGSCSVRNVWFSRLSIPPVGVPLPGGFVSLQYPKAVGQSPCVGEGWVAADPTVLRNMLGKGQTGSQGLACGQAAVLGIERKCPG